MQAPLATTGAQAVLLTLAGRWLTGVVLAPSDAALIAETAPRRDHDRRRLRRVGHAK